MSARVLNPAMMSEMGHRGISLVAGGGGGSSSSTSSSSDGGARAAPTRAALARVRRDLFGPVDHAAARALAERELRAQSLLDAERWGFDFHLEIPRTNSRYEWEPVTSREVVPEPYALRGMPYLRKHAPGPRRNVEKTIDIETARAAAAATSRKRILSTTASMTTTTTTTTTKNAAPSSPISTTTTPAAVAHKVERTPPQEPRVPDNGETTITTTMMSAMTATATATTTIITSSDDEFTEESYGRKKCGIVPEEPTTPVLPIAVRKQQSSITDFMKSRKRTLNGSTKSIVELPEKIARNAGQIRS